jgi:hypothetical protein
MDVHLKIAKTVRLASARVDIDGGSADAWRIQSFGLDDAERDIRVFAWIFLLDVIGVVRCPLSGRRLSAID